MLVVAAGAVVSSCGGAWDFAHRTALPQQPRDPAKVQSEDEDSLMVSSTVKQNDI